jgi:hypothetical protein
MNSIYDYDAIFDAIKEIGSKVETEEPKGARGYQADDIKSTDMSERFGSTKEPNDG